MDEWAEAHSIFVLDNDVYAAGYDRSDTSGNTIAGINPTRTSSEMQTFIKTQIFAAPLSGIMTIDQTLNEMERIRLAAKAAKAAR